MEIFPKTKNRNTQVKQQRKKIGALFSLSNLIREYVGVFSTLFCFVLRVPFVGSFGARVHNMCICVCKLGRLPAFSFDLIWLYDQKNE